MRIAIIPAVLAAALLSACNDPQSATRALEDAGYSNVLITGYRFFGCGKDDTYHTGFTAKGPTGHSVTGVVCAGWFKGSTIRLD